jgi:hypothetical protein
LFGNTKQGASKARHTHAWVAHAEGLAVEALALDHVVASEKFLTVSAFREGERVWVFGSGPWRESAVYLARVATGAIANREAWEYYTGSGFAAGEAAAVPIVDERCVGELSVRPVGGLYLMTYVDGARRVVLRTSAAPDGRWSDPVVLVDPAAEGMERWVHARSGVVGHDDGLAERGKEDEPGGWYASALVPAWCTTDGAGHRSVVHVLSTWNRRAVHVLRTVLAEEGAPDVKPPERGKGLAPARLANPDFAAGDLRGWETEGDRFHLWKGADKVWRLTSFTSKKDAAVGKVWQEFTVDAATSELRFKVSGGDAAVKLLVGDQVVRAVTGRRIRNPADEVPVVFRLDDLRGQRVRLVVDDDTTAVWGQIQTTGFELR